MGREIRRMALDFDWPLEKVWKGYLNPHYEKCPVCTNSRGYTDAYLLLDEFTRILFTAAEASDDRPEDYVPRKDLGRSLGYLCFRGQPPPAKQPKQWPFDTDPAEVLAKIAGMEVSEHVAWVIRRLACVVDQPGMWSPQMARYEWTVEDGKRIRRTVMDPKGNMYYHHPYLVEDYGIADVGPEFHLLVRALGGKPHGLGWGDGWDIQKAIIEYHGDKIEDYNLPEWCICPVCKGDGLHPDAKEDYENWKSYEPPKGEGYQLWSTTTEGHPMSPVFDTPEKLARWLVDNKVSTFGYDNTLSYEGWLKFILGPGWAPSMIGNDATGEIQTGVEWAIGGDE